MTEITECIHSSTMTRRYHPHSPTRTTWSGGRRQEFSHEDASMTPSSLPARGSHNDSTTRITSSPAASRGDMSPTRMPQISPRMTFTVNFQSMSHLRRRDHEDDDFVAPSYYESLHTLSGRRRGTRGGFDQDFETTMTRHYDDCIEIIEQALKIVECINDDDDEEDWSSTDHDRINMIEDIDFKR